MDRFAIDKNFFWILNASVSSREPYFMVPPMLLTPVAPLLALDPPESHVVAIILLYYIVKKFS